MCEGVHLPDVVVIRWCPNFEEESKLRIVLLSFNNHALLEASSECKPQTEQRRYLKGWAIAMNILSKTMDNLELLLILWRRYDNLHVSH